MISTHVSRASALLLAAGGLVLLFAADVVLPRLIPAFPAAGAWLGQLLGAAWLAVAALDWLTQGAMLGGIYNRPVVLTNLALHFVTAMVLAKVVAQPDTPPALWLVLAATALLAAVYGWLLLRGPAKRDFESR